jgi:hypothetical protein
VQPLTGGGEGAALDDRAKNLELAKIHAAFLSC